MSRLIMHPVICEMWGERSSDPVILPSPNRNRNFWHCPARQTTPTVGMVRDWRLRHPGQNDA